MKYFISEMIKEYRKLIADVDASYYSRKRQEGEKFSKETINLTVYSNSLKTDLYSSLFTSKIFSVLDKVDYVNKNSTEYKDKLNKKLSNLSNENIIQFIHRETSKLKEVVNILNDEDSLINKKILVFFECYSDICKKEDEFIIKYKKYKESKDKLEASYVDYTGNFDYKNIKSLTKKRINKMDGIFAPSYEKCNSFIKFKYGILNSLVDLVKDRRKYFQDLISKINSICEAIKEIEDKRREEYLFDYLGKLNKISGVNYDKQEAYFLDDEKKYIDYYSKKEIYSLDDEESINRILKGLVKYSDKLMTNANSVGADKKFASVQGMPESVTLGVIKNPLYSELSKRINNSEYKEKLDDILTKYLSINSKAITFINYKMSLRKPLSIFVDNTMMYEYGKEIITKMISNIICDMPVGLVNNIQIDTVYAGRYYTEFNEIRRINNSIVGEKIYTMKKDIDNVLNMLIEEIVEITQNKLGNTYDNIYEYNIENTESIEKLRLVSIFGFPNLFDNSMMEKLINIAISGPKCGVNLLIDYEGVEKCRVDLSSIKKLKNEMNVFKVSHDYYFKPEYFNFDFEYFENIFYYEEKEEIYKLLANDLLEKEKVGFTLKSLGSNGVSENAAEELLIPIGRDNKGVVQSISLGKGVSHHGLIAGQTGSGKSTLLHTIILSCINNYTPDDLNIYLMDFKEGIEFKLYSKYRIPHIKLIALESQVEFGESILEFMVKEIQSRGKIFKANEVENLKGYKDKTGKIMPRILLIIDEFTNLFNRNQGREITNNNAQLMKKIINQGRAFGINVIMASQTIKDTYDTTLAEETIEQMAVRIGLKCTPKDAAALMGADNNEISKLGNEIGAAVYNNENGRGESSRFRVAYVNSECREEILANVEERFKDNYLDYKCRVFDGNDSVNVEKDFNSVFNNDNAIKLSPYVYKVWIGEPIKIGEPVSIRFNQGMNNVAIVSKDELHIERVLMYFMMSIVRQCRLLNANYVLPTINLIDYNYNLLENSEVINRLVQGNSDLIETTDTKPASIIITDIYNEFISRREKNNFKANPMYLIINGLQKARDLLIKSSLSSLKSESSLFGFSEKNETTLTIGKMFEILLKEGGDYGIFVVITCDNLRSYTNIGEKLGYRLNDFINLRIVFNMNGRDGERFIRSSQTETLNESTGIFYDDVMGIINKFRIYSEPTLEWIEEKYIKGE
ncbi:FtsK/SpoIIIE domain-containing protein [Clostridium perfringens]